MNPTLALETERLILLPLTTTMLSLWVNDIRALEKELNFRYDAEPMEGVFREIVSRQLDYAEQAPEEYMWRSFWFLIRREDRVVIGAADFKTPPDENGETEIGYGLGKSYEHRGYMTEAVKAMCLWAKEQDGVKHIIAETDLDGAASQNILKSCGFTEYQRGETLWWKL